MSKWLLIDGYNMAFRSFYGIPELTRADGFHTNAIHGWVRTLWYLEDKEKPDQIVVFFDLGGAQEREALMPDYKANRGEMPEALREQIPWLKKIAMAMGYPLVERNGVEADDLMASAAIQLAEKGHDTYLVSSDKDLAQILNTQIKQLLPPPTANPKLGWRLLDVAGVKKKFGVHTDQIVDYLSLIGDSSDNIPGVPGVGPKTAQKWIDAYGSVEGVLEKANYIDPKRFQVVLPQHAEQLRMNLKMITLKTDHAIDNMDSGKVDAEGLLEMLKQMEMRKALEDAKKRYGIGVG